MTSKLLGVAAYVANLPRGERAELRRLRRRDGDLPPEVFWRIVARYDIDPSEEVFWQAIIPLMVAHEHMKGRRPGHALAEADVSSARVQRWLRSNRERALAEAGRLFSQVGTGVDWRDLGFLLLGWKEEGKRGFARDFFLSRERRDRSTGEERGDEA